MTTLVTGGAGFIGHHLIKEIIKNDDVICVDNLSTSSNRTIKELQNLSPRHMFTFIPLDICDQIVNFKFNRCYHLACPASPVHYRQHSYEVLKTCTIGMFNVIESCRRSNAKMLFTSSSDVYGDPEIIPQSEVYWGNVNPIGERACYDEGKRVGEAIMVNSNINYSIARIFNTYGPGMNSNDSRVVSEFIISALLDKPIKVHGTGDQHRCFCYIDDTVSALIKLMKSDEKGPINIGNNRTFITINKLAELIKDLTNSKSEIIHTAPDKDDPKDRLPRIDLAKDKLNWEPTIDLESGLKETIKYYEKILNDS